MIPTFVFGWPEGSEHGDYLAVDLGACSLSPDDGMSQLTLAQAERICASASSRSLARGDSRSRRQSTASLKNRSILTRASFSDSAQSVSQTSSLVTPNPADSSRARATSHSDSRYDGWSEQKTCKQTSAQFSYPCHQERIDHGELIRWTKGFGAPNAEGHDVAQIFRECLADRVSHLHRARCPAVMLKFHSKFR